MVGTYLGKYHLEEVVLDPSLGTYTYLHTTAGTYLPTSCWYLPSRGTLAIWIFKSAAAGSTARELA